MSRAPEVNPINFLPGWYANRAASRRRRQRQLALGGVMILALAWAWLGMRSTAADVAQHRAALEQRELAAQAQAVQLAELQGQRQQLAEQAARYDRFARPVDLHRINDALSSLTPRSIFLRGLSSELVSRKPKSADRAVTVAGGGAPEVEPERFLLIELEGTAPSNLQIANYVARLSSTPLFRNVQMIHAKQGEIGRAVTRQFKITMEVPLDRRYRFTDQGGADDAG